MADNILIDVGGDESIATDDVSGNHYQRIKLADGTANSSTPINSGSGVATNALRVVLATDVALPAGTNKLGGVDTDADSTPGSAVPATALFVAGTDGTNARGLATDASGNLQVDVLTLPALGAGTANIGDVDVLSLPGVEGTIDHGTADADAPVKVGGRARSALITPVDSDDRADFITDLFARMLVSHIPPEAQMWKSAAYATTQTGTALWTPTGGKRIAVTSLSIGLGLETAGDLILFYSDSGDTSYTAGSDQLLGFWHCAGPGSAPPAVKFSVPVFCTTADRILRVTTTNNLVVELAVYGYEF